ncbi:capsular polysaccharide type 8 biosynthesis protein cap8A [Clostridium puniceum]|uniref:Capsular polysaccharide type 8 biosynthesis protein cap8A n=1 Tax=Clostridium puniceum TaxID=29367 RepID=A0A1S8TDH4_9CLOT|nr:Wzz/FepE/Etk N-terminal domain-containing protein [Clostridium puniceum]OOM75823.1 capsular polysaccharide type 8 biosynthesis protein cap8A [Clostridium puniceum]
MEEMDLEIQNVFTILKNRWKTIAGITAIITVFVAIISFFIIKPVYEVNTKVFIGKEENKNVEYNNNDVQMYQKLLKTYSELIKTKDLIENATNENNLNITSSEIMNVLKINPMTDTQILEISYQNKDKVLAKNVLVAVTDEFIKESKELIPNGTVKVIESAQLPQEPVSPNKKTNIAIACLVGFIIGIATALFMEYMDDTLKTKEQTEKIMELPVIGIIPCVEKN